MSQPVTKTLGAFTEVFARPYPPYVNVSHDLTDDVVVITLRGAPGEINVAEFGEPVRMTPYQGETTKMTVSPEDFAQMLGEIISNCDDDIKERIIRYATEVE